MLTADKNLIHVMEATSHLREKSAHNLHIAIMLAFQM